MRPVPIAKVFSSRHRQHQAEDLEDAAMVGTKAKAATIATDPQQEKILGHLLKAPKSGDLEAEEVEAQLRNKHVGYYDVVATFRKMEEAGMGRLIVGRRGGTTRFRWGAQRQNGHRRVAHKPYRRTQPEPQPAGAQVTITLTFGADTKLSDILRNAVVSST